MHPLFVECFVRYSRSGLHHRPPKWRWSRCRCCVQAGDAKAAWLAFCTGVAGEQAPSGIAGESQQLPYHERIPQLTTRLGNVLAPGVSAPDASEGRHLVCMLSMSSCDWLLMKLPKLSSHSRFR